MDIFCEYMVSRKRNAKDFGIIAGTVFAAILLSLLLTMLLGAFAFVFICGVWFGAWWLVTMTDIEYEYIVTSTILDVDKITAKRRRKRILSIDLKEIADCRAIEDMTASGALKVIDATPSGIEDGVYGIDFDKNGIKNRLLFKPGKKMLKEIKKASPSLVVLRAEDITE